MDLDQLSSYLVAEGGAWIQQQRLEHGPSASYLPLSVQSHLQPYFGETIVGRAKFKVVPQLQNPRFYTDLKGAGISIPLDFTQMHGITLDDVVLLKQSEVGGREEARLVFHELVHVTQYYLLGFDRFMSLYVQGWAASNFDYYSIPLEVEAYSMDSRYSNGHQFSVIDELKAKYNAA